MRTLVFNPHARFERLREQGRYDGLARDDPGGADLRAALSTEPGTPMSMSSAPAGAAEPSRVRREVLDDAGG